MQYDAIRFEIQDGIARLTINRPDKMNALTLALLGEVRDALRSTVGNPAVRTVILTGAGRGFCAGLDLTAPRTPINPNDRDEPLREFFLPAVQMLKDLRIPTIAAINGAAIGAGLALALACDVVIAARSAYFTSAFVNIGLVPDTGASWLLQRSLGDARAAALMLTGEKLVAEKAADWGLIWKCVEDDQLMPECDALAAKFASGPTVAYGYIRKLLQKAGTNSFTEQARLEGEYQSIVRTSDDAQEARTAFREKRKPVFRGN